MTTQLSESLSIRDGRLFMEECDVAELAAFMQVEVVVAEVVREKLLERTRNELPYTTGVVVDLFEESERLLHVADLAAADAAIQAHGGYGYTREYMVEKIKRDVRITTIYEGTSEIQQNIIGVFRWKKTVSTKGAFYEDLAAVCDAAHAEAPACGCDLAAAALLRSRIEIASRRAGRRRCRRCRSCRPPRRQRTRLSPKSGSGSG